jgi:hypothetical protein
MRHLAMRSLLIVLVLAMPLAPALADEAKVTYVSGSTVYLEAGSENGLAVGALIELVRSGQVVAQLRVTYVTGKRATATPEGASPELVVGDVVRFTPAAPPATAAAGAPAAAATESTEKKVHDAGIRGRIGFSFLAVRDNSGLGQDFTQPSLDLRVTGTQVGGAPFDFDIDLRPRRTYRTRFDGVKDDTSSNRFYSLMGAWRPGDFKLAFGRQMNPSLGPIVLFDGLLGEYRHERFAAGVFAGTEPDPVSYGFDSGTRDYGAYFEGTSAPGAKTRYWLDGGLLSSTTQGEVNRDMAYFAGRVIHGGFTSYLLQQVDINRGWRKTAEGSDFTNSGTFVSLRYSFAQSWSIGAGYDSRRNVRVYRDFVTPATEFDDAYRQGYWAGIDWRPKGHWLIGLDARASRGGSAGSADSDSLVLGATNWTKVALDVTVRGTHYTGPYLDGTLYVVSASFDLGSRVRWEFRGGGRNETDNNLFQTTRSVMWYGTELQVMPWRHAFLTLAWDRTSGGEENNDQAYATLSWRF